MSDCIQNTNTITQYFVEILAICYFEKLWACRTMADHTKQKLNNYYIVFIDVWLYAKYRKPLISFQRY